MARPRGKLFALLAIFAAIGLITASGAFTSVTATRTATVSVADDADALLAIEGNSSSTGDNYVTQDGNGEVVIDFSTLSGGDFSGSDEPSGLNTNATTNVSHLLNITNQGTQDVDIYLTEDLNDVSGVDVLLYVGDDTSTSIEDAAPAESTSVSPGETVSVGISIDITGDPGDFSGNVTIHADASG